MCGVCCMVVVFVCCGLARCRRLSSVVRCVLIVARCALPVVCCLSVYVVCCLLFVAC